MRIGIDVRVAEPSEPGQQRYLWRLGAWLGAHGHDCHFLTLRQQPPDVIAPEGTVLERLHRLSRSELRRRVRDLELDVLLLNPERARRYRGIRANALRAGYGTDHYGQKLRSFRNPVERGLRRGLRVAPWVLAERRWERAYYEAGPVLPEVIAQSEYMRREILDSYRIPPERVHVVHNAIDATEFNPEWRTELRAEMRRRWGIGEDALCLLFLGHNFRLKGLWQLLRVLPRVARGVPAHLLVVGRGTGAGQRRKAARLVERRGLGDRVTLAGPVATSLEAYAAADALLHLSWHDSFGFVALEAMACGLPVVTTRYTGASELLEDGVSGLLVDPARDDELLAAAMRLADPEERSRLGAAAAAVGARHDEEANFGRLTRVLSIAGARAPGPVA